MLTALVLVCSLAITPDLAACDNTNATDVIRVPAEFTSPATCLMQAQAYVAESTIGRELAAEERIKVLCTSQRTIVTTIRPMVVE